MSALDEIAEQLKRPETEGEYYLSRKAELLIVFTHIAYILVVSFTFYFGSALILALLRNEGWSFMISYVLGSSFAVGMFSVILLSGRGFAASGIFLASSIRQAWTGKKPEQGSFAFYRDFAFGTKIDTIAFYGSTIVFIVTFIFLR